MKLSSTVKLCAVPGSHMPDGSYLSVIKGKIEDPAGSANGRKKWKKVELVVRVIVFQIRGFRPVRLITTILDPAITAKEIIKHYHKRWDIEIAYDEIKTHQCATLRGQMPTIIRSKRADLVEQELYAMLIMYNLIRSLIHEAASKHGKDPLLISFLDSLQLIIDGAPSMSNHRSYQRKRTMFDYLLALIADSPIDRPRRLRVNSRVVKVKMSKYRRKRSVDKSKYRDFEKELTVIIQREAA